MRTFRLARTALVIPVLLVAEILPAVDAPDLGTVDRAIVREPKYTSREPLYGLYVFGPKAATRVWAVLDTSAKEADVPDVLYFDLNGNGDLTEKGERFEGAVSGSGEDASASFSIGSFVDPATRETHTELSLSVRGGERGRVFFSMKWKDTYVVRGGYADKPGPYTRFAPRREEAPVLWPGADGPFSFQAWIPREGEDVPELVIGDSGDLLLFLGHAGVGPNTFCAVPDTFLPKEVPVIATLVYTDRAGKERRVTSKLKERC